MAKRKSLSKKIRFEVFKRDSFTCQYCGKRAPDVILEVDHIHPVADGGTNDVMNLVTSCHDCNAGKGARLLSDGAEVQKQHDQAAILQERRNQLEMMREWTKELANIGDMEDQVCCETFNSGLRGRSLSQAGKQKLSELRRRFGVQLVIEAIEIGVRQYLYLNADGETEAASVRQMFMKLGGICYNLRQRQGDDLGEEKGLLAHRLNVAYGISRGTAYQAIKDISDRGHLEFIHQALNSEDRYWAADMLGLEVD